MLKKKKKKKTNLQGFSRSPGDEFKNPFILHNVYNYAKYVYDDDDDSQKLLNYAWQHIKQRGRTQNCRMHKLYNRQSKVIYFYFIYLFIYLFIPNLYTG